MADLCDLNHYFGEDVGVTASGDIATASNHDRTVQRVIRRLLTPAAGQGAAAYAWQPEYGAGLSQMVGQENIDAGRFRAAVLSQLLIEPTVARTPLPTVTVIVAPGSGTITLDVNYTDLSGAPQTFGFDLA